MDAARKSGWSNRRHPLELGAVFLALGTLSPAALAAGGGFGRLIAHGQENAPGAQRAAFSHVLPPRQFRLVVSDPTAMRIRVGWSITCFDPARRAHGGASGQATVARASWVKRIDADWIAHPAFCSGAVHGSAGSGSVRIRVYAA